MNASAVVYQVPDSVQPSRRCSIESILSIQGKETDIVCDTSDTEPYSASGEEFEPVTEPEDDQPILTSGESDSEIIATKVIEVSVGSDGDLQLADSEQTDSDCSDSEIDHTDYWRCVQCRTENNNPRYRYCQKCFEVRKNFFPPRPKRKRKHSLDPELTVPRTLSQDSGVESQELSQTDQPSSSQTESEIIPSKRPRLEICEKDDNLCIVCLSEPKSGVFVHGRIAHICCCYKCAVKVWAKAKRCPVCNCRVSNVLKAVVM